MSEHLPTLTHSDHNKMDAFLDYLLEEFKNQKLTKSQVAGALKQIIGALDKGNTAEVLQWFENGKERMHLIDRR